MRLPPSPVSAFHLRRVLWPDFADPVASALGTLLGEDHPLDELTGAQAAMVQDGMDCLTLVQRCAGGSWLVAQPCGGQRARDLPASRRGCPPDSLCVVHSGPDCRYSEHWPPPTSLPAPPCSKDPAVVLAMLTVLLDGSLLRKMRFPAKLEKRPGRGGVKSLRSAASSKALQC